MPCGMAMGGGESAASAIGRHLQFFFFILGFGFLWSSWFVRSTACMFRFSPASFYFFFLCSTMCRVWGLWVWEKKVRDGDMELGVGARICAKHQLDTLGGVDYCILELQKLDVADTG